MMTTNRTRMMVMTGMFAGVTAVLAAQAPAITRTVLQRADMSWMNHEAVTAKADFPADGSTGRHTHPGDEVSYVLEGTINFEMEGMPAKMLKAGDVFFVPGGKVHNATATSGKAVVIANYLVEKGKPLTTAAQ